MLYLFFLGLFQSMLTAVIIARKPSRKPADNYLLLLVLCFAIHFLSSFLVYELSSNAYFRRGFLNFTLLANGPLMLLYALRNKHEPQHVSRYRWLLAPAILWSVPYISILGLWLAGSFSNYTYLLIYNRSLLVVLWPLNIACFVEALRVSGSYAPEQAAVRSLIRIVSVVGIVTITFGLCLSVYIIAAEIPFGLLHQVVRSIGSAGMLTSCLAIARYALTENGPRVFAVHTAPKPARPSQLNKERQKEIYDQLTDKVRQQRLFLDPDLNMEKLTTATGYSRHQISEVLNQYGDISFYPFINRFRIEQVCEQMKKASAKPAMPSLNMLDLSYACGFRSKSSFNEYFRRFTGQTPSEYLSELHLKEKKV